MTPSWMVPILEAAQKGHVLSFRAQHQRQDWFVCIAEWQEIAGVRSERALRFRCDSDRKADWMAEQLMREQIARFSDATA